MSAATGSPLQACPARPQIIRRMYVLQRSILQRRSIDRVPRMLRVCQSAQSSPTGRGCLSMVRACRSWTELADFKMNSRHGHVSQHHKADWRTRMVCIWSLSFTLASDMSVPLCLLKARLLRACISATKVAGVPRKHSGLPKVRTTWSGPLHATF